MRRRTPSLLLLLALVGVCLLLWDTFVTPAGSGDGEAERGSILDDEDLLSADAEGGAGLDAPTLAGTGRKPLSVGGGPLDGTGSGGIGGMEGPAAGGPSNASVPFVGRVLGADGRPAVGVKIVMRGPGGVETLETDADGAFQHGAPPGRYALYFDGGTDGGLMLRSWMLDGAAPDDLEFTLREPATVEVKVERGTEGVAGVAVVITSTDLGDLVQQEGSTSLDGLLTFEGLVPGRYDVAAEVPDGPAVRHTLNVRPGKANPVRVRIPDGVTLQGTVRSGAGGPGVAARITLHTSARGSSGVFETVFETGTDGAYEVVVPMGSARKFEVEAEGYAAWPSRAASRGVLKSLRGLSRKQGPVTRNVVLDTGAALSGKLLLAEGTPLAGITLRFAMRRGPTATATTQTDGTYRVLHLAPGAYDLQIETPGWFPAREQTMRVVIPKGAAPKPTTLDIRVHGARRLDGFVVDGTGQGLGGARVWIVGGGRVVRSARDAGRVLEVFTNANGSWIIGDIPPDQNVAVRAAMGELEADPVSVRWESPPPSPLRLVLKGTGTLTGSVVDLDSREPVGGARVRLQPEPYDGRTSRTVTANGRGAFTVARVLPGRWKLVPSAKNYLVSTGETVTVQAEEETTADLRLDPGLVFAGVVVDAAGAPLRYARVIAAGVPDGKERGVSRAMSTDAAGRFRVTGCQHGSYTITITRRGFVTQRLRDRRSSERALRIVLQRPTRR